MFESSIDDERELRKLDGFRDVVVGAGTHSLHGVLDSAECGKDDDGNGRGALSDLFQEIEAAHSGHSEVGQNQFKVPRFEYLEGFLSG